MINPRTSTEFWDDAELETPLHYPHATRRRAIIAHSLGIVGVLGTLALGVAAIVPHASYLSTRARMLFASEQPAQQSLRPAVPVAPAVTPPATVETKTEAAPELPSVPAASEPPTPAVTATEVQAPVAPVAATPDAPAAVAPEAPAALAPEAPAATAPVAPATTVTTADAKATAPAAVPDKPARSVVAAPPSRTEPRLTWAEIERRKARYDAWLKAQGLEPVH